MNCNQWIVKRSPLFESNIKGFSRSLLRVLDMKIERLKKNPYIGGNLGSRRSWLWEIYVGARFRLYYEIWERKCIIYLKAFYPKKLQKRYLQQKVIF